MLRPGRWCEALHEQVNPRHRLRVEHDPHTLLIHLSDEDGDGVDHFRRRPGHAALGPGSGTSPERQRPQRLWRPLRSLTECSEARIVAGGRICPAKLVPAVPTPGVPVWINPIVSIRRCSSRTEDSSATPSTAPPRDRCCSCSTACRVPGSTHRNRGRRRPRRVRVISPDRPGFGMSTFQPYRRLIDWADDVAVLADAVGADQFLVAGFSGGGPHALAVAHGLPDRVRAVAVIGGAGPIDAPDSLTGMNPANRLIFTLARRAPVVLRLLIAPHAHQMKRHPAKVLERSASRRQTPPRGRPGGNGRSAPAEPHDRSGSGSLPAWQPWSGSRGAYLCAALGIRSH